jgi:ABC-type phosphate transport system substrate-binding protein
LAIGADVPIYNVPGVIHELNFTPRALAGIYLGYRAAV